MPSTTWWLQNSTDLTVRTCESSWLASNLAWSTRSSITWCRRREKQLASLINPSIRTSRIQSHYFNHSSQTSSEPWTHRRNVVSPCASSVRFPTNFLNSGWRSKNKQSIVVTLIAPSVSIPSYTQRKRPYLTARTCITLHAFRTSKSSILRLTWPRQTRTAAPCVVIVATRRQRSPMIACSPGINDYPPWLSLSDMPFPTTK